MTTSTRAGLRTLIAAPLALLLALSAAGASSAQEAPVGLGTAGSFAILAGTAITNTGPSVIIGDIGLHPGSAVTGDDQWDHDDGEEHFTDDVAEEAQEDLETAYDDAAGRDVTETIPTELGGQTLGPGVYDSSDTTFEITETLILDADGDPDAVFIFQMGTTLTTATGSAVELLNGAQACNVFWQVGSSATLGTGSTFAGNILALTAITVQNGATIDGRVLARNAAVTLDTATITRADCVDTTDDDGAVDDDGTDDDGTDDDGVTDDGAATPDDGPTDDGTTDDGTTDDGDATDGQVTTSGPPAGEAPPGLPRTGAPFVLLAIGVVLLALGRGALRATRPGRHSA